MALDLCSCCGSIEGGWHETTEDEAKATDWFIEEFMEINSTLKTCDQCGEVGTKEGIPEHDDHDLER